MNLQNMEYLIEISNCGSISAAAKHLFVTQPYLSKVLRETEKEYGLTIFTRGKNGIIFPLFSAFQVEYSIDRPV